MKDADLSPSDLRGQQTGLGLQEAEQQLAKAIEAENRALTKMDDAKGEEEQEAAQQEQKAAKKKIGAAQKKIERFA